MMVSSNGDLEVQMLISLHEFGNLWTLQGVSDTPGGTAPIAEIKSNVFQLMDAAANHI